MDRWRNRDLSQVPIKYLILGGVCFDMRIDGSVEKFPVLVAVGVTETGHKLVWVSKPGIRSQPPIGENFSRTSRHGALMARR
ncbi:MAG: transposase [Deltaproteobacteria bacterium]|nr:transposase [Deltaproteobacteria bacterium]